MFVAKAEAAKAEALQQTPSARLLICTNALWQVLKGNLGKNTSLVYMKVHEHSSTSVINREALELHTKRNLKLQLVNGTCTEAGQPPSWI